MSLLDNAPLPQELPPVTGTEELADGSVRVDLGGEQNVDPAGKQPLPAAGGPGHFDNLANSLDESVLQKLGSEALDRIRDEMATRQPWIDFLAKAIDLLGLADVPEATGIDAGLPKGAQTTSTLMLAGVQRFVANACREIGYVDGPIEAKHIDMGGKRPPDAGAVEERVRKFFNRYLLVRMPQWFDDMDRTLLNFARMGPSFKKVWADPNADCPLVVEQIDPQNLIVPFDSRALYSGSPITHRIPNMLKHELLRRMQSGFYRTTSLTTNAAGTEDSLSAKQRETQGTAVSIVLENKDTAEAFERHVMLLLDEDRHPGGLPRPYILTVMASTGFVLRLQRNWEANDQSERMIRYFPAYKFQPGDSSVYGIGLCQLLYAITLACKEGVNQALAAAWLANHPSGLALEEFGLDREGTKLKFGELASVGGIGGDISKMVMAWPFKGPDVGLMNLMEKLDSDGRELAGMLTVNVAESAGLNTAPGTILAALDEASVIPASSHVRLYLALSEEFNLMLTAARRLWSGGYELEPGYRLEPGDLDRVILVPAMRPGAFSRQRRIAEAQTILSTAQAFPQQHDVREALKRFYEACGVEDIDTLMPPEEEVQPADVITEGSRALAGKPLTAGWLQDHMSHIRAHVAQVQLYASRADLGDGATMAAAALQAHCADHLGKMIAVSAAQMLGIPMEMLQQGIPPELELQIAPMVAQAIEVIAEKLKGEQTDPADLALAIEQMKGEFAQRREVTKSQTAITVQGMRDATAKYQERQKTGREVMDNAAALRIAQMRGTQQRENAQITADADVQSPTAEAGAKAGTKSPPAKAGGRSE